MGPCGSDGGPRATCPPAKVTLWSQEIPWSIALWEPGPPWDPKVPF